MNREESCPYCKSENINMDGFANLFACDTARTKSGYLRSAKCHIKQDKNKLKELELLVLKKGVGVE